MDDLALKRETSKRLFGFEDWHDRIIFPHDACIFLTTDHGKHSFSSYMEIVRAELAAEKPSDMTGFPDHLDLHG